MTIKSFSTAAKSVEDNQIPIGAPLEIEFDDRKIVLNPPTTGQWAVTMAGNSDSSDTREQLATQINFFFSLLEDQDASWFRHRLFDRDDPFDVDNIAELIEYAMEEWAGRPTTPSSTSSTARSNGGKRSTAVQAR